MSKIKVLLVDDHTLMRDGLASILYKTEDIVVVGTPSSGEEAINQTRDIKPDVVLMDIIMKGMTGIEAARWIKEQDASVKIILISMEVKKEFISAGIKAGIDGYLHKDSDKETLIEAIRSVMKGEKYFNEAITKLVFEDFYTNERTDKEEKPERKKLSGELTKREYEVLEWVAEGKSNKEVADHLFISVKTVETHKMHILEKLGLKNTAEVVKYAIKNKIIPL
jgi:DNA-binding NarL/FixJ family response regulator